MKLEKPLVIVGPAACGKTRNKERFRKFYGAVRVIDGWRASRFDILRPGDLALAQVVPPSPDYDILSFGVALAAVEKSEHNE